MAAKNSRVPKRKFKRPNAASDGHRRLLSIRQAHRDYGPSEDQWFRWIGNGDVSAIRPPNCRRVWLDRDEVERLLFVAWKERGP